MFKLVNNNNEIISGPWYQIPNPMLLPNGDQVCAASVGTYQDWQLIEFEEPTTPFVPSLSDVNIERKRRLALGFDYDFGDSRGIHHIGTTQDDMEGWSDVDRWANSHHGLGQDDVKTIIMTDTGQAIITPIDWYTLQMAGAIQREKIWQASFTLASMNPIPDDYTDDKYWK